ncbi:non-specific lipid transfer protein-like 1 [Panicum virgatum]|uniref:Bifunctional inhibitor/plant lipid transfer protein/seed storage helical domain-containing protein n=1 Tax=Panicum virgatum TaxID=38727 RepID=A0A8T0WG78_PANVG|nr:non-specific lipid transfer protein-like 1 [Panicum virgatum]KAG2646930.1 hypothetical protein PVAP13_2KG544000 [Panicum virgatum]
MARLGLGMPCLLAAAAAVAVLALAPGAASQAPAPAPAPASSADCSSAFTSLIGCLSYVQQGSAQAKPGKECCAGVKSALKSPAAVTCLCAALGQNNGVPINFTRAATLPAACGENPAALSNCNIKLPGAPTEGPSSGSAPAANSPGTSKSAAARSPVSAFAIVAAVATPLLSYYFL